MAGNDTEGLRYGTIETPEKYYLTWKEDSPVENVLDRALTQMCAQARFLELVHDFIMQKVLSSQSRLEQIVADILMDMATRNRLSRS